MKKITAIYFALFSMLFVTVSCGSSDEENYELSPYAMIKSFKLGNIKSEYPSFTADGKDTTVVRTVSFENVAFTIDQLAGEVYNNDSLPYATDVSKVVAYMGVSGVASIYVDSTETYEHFSSADSVDFTSPRKMRIYSADASYYKDYTVSINVHQVDPEMMVWQKYPAAEGVGPVRALERDGMMYLFGTKADGTVAVATTQINGVPSWNVNDVRGLPATALATIQLFGGNFYAVADGNVYSSSDAVQWSVVATGTGAVAIVGVSDEEQKLWIAGDQGLLCSTDGLSFTPAGALPEGFPLYGVSIASYPLSHNKGIIRYMLVGYADEANEGNATVWSRLSTEERWTCYNNVGNAFPCPSLAGLSVVRYDNFLYAFGGAGKVNGVESDAFSSFYVSKDNGIVWRPLSDPYQHLPEELLGDNSQFAVAVDARNHIWIINSGENGGVWRGILNRLGFEK